MGGLIGVATAEKEGLLSSILYKKLVIDGDIIKSLETSKTGIYQYNLDGNNTYAPIPSWPWGTIAIFGGKWGVIQFATSTQNSNYHIYARMGRIDSGTFIFTQWSTII